MQSRTQGSSSGSGNGVAVLKHGKRGRARRPPGAPRTVTGEALGTQLWVNRGEPVITKVEALRNAGPPQKPSGGIWTSSYDTTATGRGAPQEASDWVAWSTENEYMAPEAQDWWLLQPSSDVVLLEIHDLDDLLAAHACWQCVRPGLESYVALFPDRRNQSFVYMLDYMALREAGYAGVHLTHAGARALHLSAPYDLNSWDCESTIWFSWCFTLASPVANELREQLIAAGEWVESRESSSRGAS